MLFKFKYLSISAILFFVFTSFKPDCSFYDLFRLEIGSSNFLVTNKLNDFGGFVKTADWTENYNEAYLNNTPVEKHIVEYNWTGNECYKGFNNQLELRFADDKLYHIEFSTKYKMEDYRIMIASYKKIIATIIDSKRYKYGSKFTSQVNGSTIQTGEGYRFEKSEKDSIKLDNVSVGYDIYKKSKDYDFDYYQITIEQNNLKGTRLTSKGY